jgi:hypothetical protein
VRGARNRADGPSEWKGVSQFDTRRLAPFRTAPRTEASLVVFDFVVFDFVDSDFVDSDFVASDFVAFDFVAFESVAPRSRCVDGLTLRQLDRESALPIHARIAGHSRPRALDRIGEI